MSLTKLDEICQIKSGRGFKDGIKPNDDGTYVIHIADVTSDRTEIDWPQVMKADVSLRTHKSLENGDILFLAKGNRNRAILISGLHGKAVATNHFFVITPNKNIDPQYLVLQLNSKIARDYFDNNASGGSKKHITKKTISELEIGLCEKAEQIARKELFFDIETFQNSIQNDFQNLSDVLENINFNNSSLAADKLDSLVLNSPESAFRGYFEHIKSLIELNQLKNDVGNPSSLNPRKPKRQKI